jgi:hypothetical protein
MQRRYFNFADVLDITAAWMEVTATGRIRRISNITFQANAPLFIT